MPISTMPDRWRAWRALGRPVYAHPLEHPYLNGQASYPPADPLVGGGAMALLSPLYPRSPVDVGARLHRLPADLSVPGMPGWQWVHTPGHTPGHVSLWRESDRTLIAGDAIVTTGQESAYAVMTQRLEMHGPPRYLTPDWMEAEASVKRLSDLKPELIVTAMASRSKERKCAKNSPSSPGISARSPCRKAGITIASRPCRARATATPIDSPVGSILRDHLSAKIPAGDIAAPCGLFRSHVLTAFRRPSRALQPF